MFDFFKNKKEDKGLDAKTLRSSILLFVKEELQRLDGGEGKGISVIKLYIQAEADNRYLYETAVYFTEPLQFKEEIQRIADNYALDLPQDWKLEVLFTDELPSGLILANQIKAGISFKTAKATPAGTVNAVKGQLTILKGNAEQGFYVLEAAAGRVNIGRERNIQANDGSFRVNTIAFPEDPLYETNKYISRQHAHVEWDSESGQFKIYADEGGVPPGNKTKIRSALDESVKKLNSTQVGHVFANGDQVILGDAAVLEFMFII